LLFILAAPFFLLFGPTSGKAIEAVPYPRRRAWRHGLERRWRRCKLWNWVLIPCTASKLQIGATPVSFHL